MVRNMTQEQLEDTVNSFWQLHDEAENAGNKELAADYARRALVLVGKLPENLVTVDSKELH